MTDREILAVIVAFSGTWVICVLLAFWVSDLLYRLRELEQKVKGLSEVMD